MGACRRFACVGQTRARLPEIFLREEWIEKYLNPPYSYRTAMDDVRRTRRTMAQDANRTKTSTRMVVSDDNALVSRSFVGVMAMSRCDVGSGGCNMWGSSLGFEGPPSPKGRKCRCGEEKNCLSCCPFPTRALLLSNNHEPKRHHQLGQQSRHAATKTPPPPTLRTRVESRWTAAASSAQRP